MTLAQSVFTQSDQMQFASASGDHNPMHLDELRSRRTQAGAPVVHGIHLLLWALDRFSAAQPELPPISGLRAEFSKFVYLGERVEVVLTKQTPARARLVISVDNTPRSKIAVDFGGAIVDCPSWSSASLEPVAYSQVPLDLDFEQVEGRSGQLSFQMTPENAEAMFPAAAQWLGTPRIAALAASTCLVGMVCPGLHSIYSELTLSACTDPGTEGVLGFRVVETDARFRSVDQEIAGGGFTGTVQGFVRTPPVQQATMTSLKEVVGKAEFADSVALVVGGSRGLGELTAKLLAAGGAHVIVTWQAGKDDAEAVAQEIRSAGGSCETLAYDARKSGAEQMAPITHAPTHAYYFATPGIFRPQGEIYAAGRLNEFLSVYVDGFWQLTQALRARQPKVSLFYPSSIAVAERPKGMTEYSMAKAAGEILSADINESLSPAHVTVSRLPRLPTDQTVSISAAETADPVETMLPIIREVQSWPR